MEVSVVVPTRDRPELLAATLAGVLAQRDVALEVVVVDDGSTTPLDAVAGFADPRVRRLRNPVSRGVGVARNRGIAAAGAPWLAFCDDDDLWAPDKLRRQLRAAEEHGRDWAIGGAVSIDASGATAFVHAPPTAEAVLEGIGWSNVIPGGCSNVVARRGLVQHLGGFDPALSNLADWDLWVRLARTGPPAVVDAPLVAYRLHATNLAANAEGLLAEMATVAERAGDLRGGVAADWVWLHRWMGQAALRAGRRRAAVGAYWRAARLGDRASLGRLLVAVAGEGVARRVRRRRHPVDPEWEARTRPWLDPLLGG